MQLITHLSHLDALTASDLKIYIEYGCCSKGLRPIGIARPGPVYRSCCRCVG